MSRRKYLLLGLLAIAFYNLMVYLVYLSEVRFEDGNIKNMYDAYWYSIVTLTTVGYGDFFPVTFLGRVLGLVFILGSLGILGLLITELSIKVTNYIQKRKEGFYGTTMKDHCIIIGYNTFSQQVATQIANANEPLAIVVNTQEDLERAKQRFTTNNCFVLYTADLNNLEALEKVNIEDSKRVYLNFEADTDTLVYTINLKKRFEHINCVVALENIDLKSSFNFLGVNFVIPKNEIVSKFVASYIFEPNVAMFTEDLIATSVSDSDIDIWESPLGESSSLNNQKYFDVFVRLKKDHNITLIGLSRNEKMIKNPEDELVLQSGDILIYICNTIEHQIFGEKF